MKKLIIIFLLLTFPIKAKEVNYSEYSNYSSYFENNIKGNELKEVKKTTMYKYYNLKKGKGEYFIFGENDSFYSMFDINDYIYSNYSKWSLIKPCFKEGRIIKEREVCYYSDIKKIRYVHFDNFFGSDNRLIINEIVVNNNEFEIPFSIYCEGCSEGFYEKVVNGNLEPEGSYILNDGYLVLDLGDYYYINSLEISFSLSNYNNNTSVININTSRENDLKSRIYNNFNSYLYFINNEEETFSVFNYKFQDFILIDPEWNEYKRSEETVLEDKFKRVELRREYSYKDILYYYYNFDREYSDYFEYKPMEFQYKDEELVKDFYQYRTRDKVVIKSNILITNKNQKLEDFIFENTTNELEIKGEVNYKKNGIYEIDYVFPFIKIKKIVEVAILENEVVNENINLDIENKEKALVNNNENTLIENKEKVLIENKKENNKVENDTELNLLDEKVLFKNKKTNSFYLISCLLLLMLIFKKSFK